MTNLVISFTPDYFVPAAVTLSSVLDASPQGEFRTFCLVTEDIPQRQMDILETMVCGRMTFRYINLKGSLSGCYVDPRYSEAASYRLLLPDILTDMEKIIYLDCDMVVRQDLSKLYETINLGGNLLAAVYEAPIEEQSERWKALGCDPGKYFNSGFLVMDLARMREEGTSAKLLEATRTDWLEFPDQDVLNMVCKGRVLSLPPVCNSIRTFFLPQYKSFFLRQYTEAEYSSVWQEGNIHYTGGKPWNLFTVRFADWWEKYDSLPASAREEWTPDGGILRLRKFYRTAAGRTIMDFARAIYRKIKH